MRQSLQGSLVTAFIGVCHLGGCAIDDGRPPSSDDDTTLSFQPQTAGVTPAAVTGTLVNLASGRCLDAALQSINSNGTTVQLWDCNGGQQQQWIISNDPARTGSRVMNAHSGRCLDAQLQTINTIGGKVQLWDCNGGQQQTWLIDPVNFTFVNDLVPWCLDAQLQSIGSNGTTIQLWRCNAGSQQQFRF